MLAASGGIKSCEENQTEKLNNKEKQFLMSEYKRLV